MKHAFFIALIILLGSCAPKETPVPRRTAYPRVETYSDSLRAIKVGDFMMDVKAQAQVSSPREGWTNITYPRYGATLYLTAVSAPNREALEDAVANRRQRMSLNAGDIPATQLQFLNADRIQCELLTARTGTTPLQFLAVAPDGVVSGAVVFSGSTEPADSIYPIIKALDEDMVALLKSLRHAD